MIGIYTAEIVEEAEPPFSLGKQKKTTFWSLGASCIILDGIICWRYCDLQTGPFYLQSWYGNAALTKFKVLMMLSFLTKMYSATVVFRSFVIGNSGFFQLFIFLISPQLEERCNPELTRALPLLVRHADSQVTT